MADGPQFEAAEGPDCLDAYILLPVVGKNGMTERMDLKRHMSPAFFSLSYRKPLATIRLKAIGSSRKPCCYRDKIPISKSGLYERQ